MKFEYLIGNPPFQDGTTGEQKAYAPPMYDKFMDGAYELSKVVELIHPARFLFNAGGTDKDWNAKMLSDPHLSVLYYEANAKRVFPSAGFKGGVAVTYRNRETESGPIETFTPYAELNQILKKVKNSNLFESLCTIVSNRGLYKFSDAAYKDFPDEVNKLSDSRIGATSFDIMPSIFVSEDDTDNREWAKFFGLLNKRTRVYRFILRKYFRPVKSFEKWKVLIPAANGSGSLGEKLSTPLIGQPLVGHTETFLSIGCFDSEEEAMACYKYVCTKFCRVMLGVLKVTQHNSPGKWKYVPLQDFTSNSDIDWTKSIPEIDQQLFAKYGLNEKEIDFIDTHVKEMKE